jgi:hypothetical protein
LVHPDLLVADAEIDSTTLQKILSESFDYGTEVGWTIRRLKNAHYEWETGPKKEMQAETILG